MSVRFERFFFPWLGRSVNEYINRGKSHWLYRRDKNDALVAATAAGLRKMRPFSRPVQITYTPRLGPRRRNFDITNYGISCKIIEDCIVENGVLIDDSVTYVRRIIMKAPERAEKSSGEGMVVVISEDLD